MKHRKWMSLAAVTNGMQAEYYSTVHTKGKKVLKGIYFALYQRSTAFLFHVPKCTQNRNGVILLDYGYHISLHGGQTDAQTHCYSILCFSESSRGLFAVGKSECYWFLQAPIWKHAAPGYERVGDLLCCTAWRNQQSSNSTTPMMTP